MNRIVATVFLTGILAITFFMGFLTRDKLVIVKSETKAATQTAELVTPINPTHKPLEKEDNSLIDGDYVVERVIDGDTIDLTNGVRIRYEGIDAPEKTASYGLDALADNQKLVNGKRVKVEVSGDRTDAFGRTLGYVWSDNIFINERLVEDGYAKVYIYSPTRPPKYLEQLQEAETRAKQDGWGMWVEEKVKDL